MNSIRAILVGAAAALGMAAAPAVHAADYPAKPVTIVIGYPAGGPTDVLMRAIAPRLTKEWGQQIIIDNKPGANESIAAQHVAKAPADGYTFLLATEMPLTINPSLFKRLSYEPAKDFTPVTLLLSSPLTLVVPNSLPVTSLQDFIRLAKSRSGSNPIAYGSSGAGSVLHFPMAMLAERNGVQMTHVPYKGVAPLVTDLVAGQVEAGWVAIAGAAPYVKDGRLKALVVGAPSRVNALPQVPVFKETGVAPVQADFIFALVAPAGTPAAITEKVSAAFRNVLNDPAFRAEFTDPYGYVVKSSTPAELGQYLAKDRGVQAERVKVSGVTME